MWPIFRLDIFISKWCWDTWEGESFTWCMEIPKALGFCLCIGNFLVIVSLSRLGMQRSGFLSGAIAVPGAVGVYCMIYSHLAWMNCMQICLLLPSVVQSLLSHMGCFLELFIVDMFRSSGSREGPVWWISVKWNLSKSVYKQMFIMLELSSSCKACTIRS